MNVFLNPKTVNDYYKEEADQLFMDIYNDPILLKEYISGIINGLRKKGITIEQLFEQIENTDEMDEEQKQYFINLLKEIEL